MPSDLELEARKLNEADRHLREGLKAYVEVGWSEEEIIERVEELYDETAMNE